MSRSKKSRKPGSAGNAELIITRSRSESDIEGRLRKRLKKRKGLKSGSRHSVAGEEKKYTAATAKDPRLGSKKKIPLIAEKQDKKTQKATRKLSAEQELAALENDAQLGVLLDRIENGEKLGAGLQRLVDEKLDRIEALMDQLGLLDQEEDEPEAEFEPQKEKKSQKKAPMTEDELLSQFEDMDISQFKDK